ncbi:hypothetical protein LBMAG18_11050 [Alphaproteobacteria bacterium]|nr:hypothetical protein LBMAG18_11050 [Alphaproteobacteria bacterium]
MIDQNSEELISLLSIKSLSIEEKNNIFERVKILLNQNTNINQKDEYGKNALHLAVLKDDIRLVNLLIEAGVDINSQDIYLNTPISLAIINGQTEIIKKLIRNNARLDYKDISGNNSLHIALRFNPSIDPELISFLIGKNLSLGVHIEDFDNYLNCQNIMGKTPLHVAAEFDNGEAIELLLHSGANSQLVTKDREKALHLAAKNFNIKALIALNQEFIKGDNISYIEDYKDALRLVNFYRPRLSSSPVWKDYINSLQILQSVVNKYTEQQNNKKQTSTTNHLPSEAEDYKGMQEKKILGDNKIANIGDNESFSSTKSSPREYFTPLGSKENSPSTSPLPISGGAKQAKKFGFCKVQ